MKLTNLQMKDFLNEKAKLTFLIGAGCSIDYPSNLAAGRAMMDAIIDYTCAQTEVEKIKKMEQLRFESLVEIIRDNLDEDLKIIDYYGQCDKPNLQHFFLAEMLLTDDITDTGVTLIEAKKVLLKYGCKEVKSATIICAPASNGKVDFYGKEVKPWVVFPWEFKS